ncbi:hypothetical protein [Uliginosibacterium sp. H1]|uniref:hypothetical protein n=1 Tax=Uliginosibacterium sp. H1 TaxID=3114757 RepID=UPI002E180582|nr:hypothetical protein [Uliginosibacterium sp. H1]
MSLKVAVNSLPPKTVNGRKVMPNAWAIGLYSYSASHPGAEGFNRFYDSVLAVFQAAGITPTYFAAEGAGYRGNLTKYGGRTHAKALRTGFSDLHVMSLVANPAESDEPAYDSFASASLAYVKDTGETLLCLALEERLLEFGGSAFENVLQSLVCLNSWDFGYALSQPAEKKPEFHVLGLDGGVVSQEDSRRLNAWYAAPPKERLRKLRDIYPYLVLNAAQLAAPVSGDHVLENVARSESLSTLNSLDGTSLWLWKIPPEAVTNLRAKLVGSGVLIT